MEARDFVAALIDAGLTQQEIADKTGIPQPTISKVSRGDVADVLSRNYRKLQALYEERVVGAAPAPEDAAAPPAPPAEPDHPQVERDGERRQADRRPPPSPEPALFPLIGADGRRVVADRREEPAAGEGGDESEGG